MSVRAHLCDGVVATVAQIFSRRRGLLASMTCIGATPICLPLCGESCAVSCPARLSSRGGTTTTHRRSPICSTMSRVE